MEILQCIACPVEPAATVKRHRPGRDSAKPSPSPVVKGMDPDGSWALAPARDAPALLPNWKLVVKFMAYR